MVCAGTAAVLGEAAADSEIDGGPEPTAQPTAIKAQMAATAMVVRPLGNRVIANEPRFFGLITAVLPCRADSVRPSPASRRSRVRSRPRRARCRRLGAWPRGPRVVPPSRRWRSTCRYVGRKISARSAMVFGYGSSAYPPATSTRPSDSNVAVRAPTNLAHAAGGGPGAGARVIDLGGREALTGEGLGSAGDEHSTVW